jgi:molybdate-binding protein
MDRNEQLVDAVLKFVNDERESGTRKQLTCTEAFELAKKFETEIIEIGHICNQHDIRICKCQLGCFA